MAKGALACTPPPEAKESTLLYATFAIDYSHPVRGIVGAMNRASETAHQIQLAEWLRHNQILFLHVPNEGERSMGTTVTLKRMGLSPGAPDILIFDVPDPRYKGVAIELKVGKGKASKDQKKWITDLRKRGWAAEVLWGFEEARDWLVRLGFKERSVVEIMDL